MIVLYILLFIVCLSTLIMVHELGHLATAKIFKVYCFEYAIGFGPKLFSKKRKNGETYFSIRAIPLGGFVSMYGEEESIPEGLEIDPSRSLLAIKKWKRAIIMAAGVIMNFILAIVVFFIYEIAFPTYTGRYGHVTISGDSIAYNAGVRSQDTVYAEILTYGDNAFILYDDNASISYQDSSTVTSYIGFDYNTLTIKDTSLVNHAIAYEKLMFGDYESGTCPAVDIPTILETDYPEGVIELNEITGFIGNQTTPEVIEGTENYKVLAELYANYGEKDAEPVILEFVFSKKDYDEKFTFVPFNSEITVSGDISDKTSDQGVKYKNITVDSFKMPYLNILGNNLLTNKRSGSEPIKISFNMYVVDEVAPSGKGDPHALNDLVLEKNSNNVYCLPSHTGISMQLDKGQNDLGTAVKETFVDFGESAVIIFKGLGQLFTEEGIKNVGGIIAIGVSTTRILQENGFGTFLFYWGLISVNLGIINLLPFPGLDGWHLLVIAVEGIFRKEIPPRVKNIVSAIGIAILFVIMILIVVKDIIGLF